MKRTQLYIDDSLFHLLNLISEDEKTSVSDLVRRAIKKVYGKNFSSKARLEALRKIRGLWKSRDDLGSTEAYVRSLRKDSRSKRLGLL